MAKSLLFKGASLMSSPNKPPKKNDKNQQNDKKSSLKFLSIILWAGVIVLMFNTCASTL